MSSFAKLINCTTRNWVTSDSDTEVVICTSDKGSNCIFAFVVDIVRAHVYMLELDILQKDPSLNLGSITIRVT